MRTFLLDEEMAGSIAVPPTVMKSLTRPVLKHLPGQHDQKTHGRGGNHGLDPAEQIAQAQRTGESMHLPFPCPPELQGAWDAAEGSDSYKMDDAANALKIRAFGYAVGKGMSHIDDEDGDIYASAAEVYSNAILRRRMDATAQQRAWDERDEVEMGLMVRHVREVRASGTLAIAAPTDVAHDVLDDGRFLSQFESNDSMGALDSDMRAMMETAMFDHHPHVSPSARPIYGYVAPDGDVLTSGVSQYGAARFVLKPETARRATMTVGDSLNTHATPIPMVGDVTPRDISNAASRTILGDDGSKLARQGPRQFARWHYFEAQIHGGVTLDDVAEVHLPLSMTHTVGRVKAMEDEERDYVEGRFREYGIPVVWYDDGASD